MSSSICWELTCDGMQVADFHLLNTTETWVKHQLFGLSFAAVLSLKGCYTELSWAELF